MSQLFTKAFWADLSERAVSTGAQSVLAVVGVDALGDQLGLPVNALTLDYKTLVGVAAGGALLAIVKAFAKLGGTAVAVKSQERSLTREVDAFLKEPDAE